MQGSRRQFLTAAAMAGAALRMSPDGTSAEEGYAPPVIGGEQLGPTALQLKTGLKIRTIETFTRDHTLSIVRVKTDDGSEGYGQLSPYDADVSAAILHRKIAPHALNQDPADVASIADRCIEANYKYPWSFVCRALTGIDTAIWDLLGRLRGKSVCELLGGKPRPLPAYGSSMSRTIKPEEEARRLVRLRDEQGFTAFKVRVGKVCGHDQDEWPGRTESLVPAVRKALGNGVAILADGNSCYTPPRAIRVGHMLEEYGYGHFEEPCPYWELEWTARVAKDLKIPVAGGEQDNDLAQWRRMIALASVDIVQPDICYIGGLTRALRVADMAAKAGLKCVPHSANLSLVTVFTLHMCAAIPNFGNHFEFTIEEDAWSGNLYSPALEVRDGRVAVPSDPGWGVRISPEWLAASTRQITDKS
jgi:L-alanine-DL-glutamate epimerase-like enolase superfamily enzyme